MSTADKLNKLLETKQAIKQAIIDKGIDVSDDTVFAEYPAKINAIEGASDIDLSNYATKDEILPIRVIDSDNYDEPYVLTGNEFTDEEYENNVSMLVFFNNVVINDGEGNCLWEFRNDLVSICLWLGDNGKGIEFVNQYGDMVGYIIDSDGVFIEEYSDYFVCNSRLEDYATKEELDNAIGDINTILDNILGEEI